MIQILAALIGRALSELRTLPNPYHNEMHAAEVVSRAKLFEATLAGRIPDDELEDLLIAAAYHDVGHSGTAQRHHSPRNIPMKFMTNERYAALVMRRHAYELLPEPRLARIEKMILATTFGQDAPPAETVAEKILLLADIGGFIKPFDAWMDESFLVLEENGRVGFPRDFEHFRQSRAGFLNNFVRPRLEAVLPLIEARARELLTGRFRDTLRGVLEEIRPYYQDRFDRLQQRSCA